MTMTVAAPPVEKIPQFINGQWVESRASEWLDVVNPATAEVLGRVPISDAAEVTRAIDAAQAAYPEWRRTPAEDRIQPLFKLKMLLEEHLDEFGRIITQENGKTFAEAKAEMRRAIENVEVAAGSWVGASHELRWFYARRAIHLCSRGRERQARAMPGRREELRHRRA